MLRRNLRQQGSSAERKRERMICGTIPRAANPWSIPCHAMLCCDVLNGRHQQHAQSRLTASEKVPILLAVSPLAAIRSAPTTTAGQPSRDVRKDLDPACQHAWPRMRCMPGRSKPDSAEPHNSPMPSSQLATLATPAAAHTCVNAPRRHERRRCRVAQQRGGQAVVHQLIRRQPRTLVVRPCLCSSSVG